MEPSALLFLMPPVWDRCRRLLSNAVGAPAMVAGSLHKLIQHGSSFPSAHLAVARPEQFEVLLVCLTLKIAHFL